MVYSLRNAYQNQSSFRISQDEVSRLADKYVRAMKRRFREDKGRNPTVRQADEWREHADLIKSAACIMNGYALGDTDSPSHNQNSEDWIDRFVTLDTVVQAVSTFRKVVQK